MRPNLMPLLLFMCAACQSLSPSTGVIAAPPPGYYSSVDASTSTSLRRTLHEVIDDHTRFPYTSTATDTWDILESAQEAPSDTTAILDLYKNAIYPKAGGGNDNYDREHVWPKSYGFPNDSSANYPYSDCHHLMLADGNYNSSRGNRPFGTAISVRSERPTVANGGIGGGSGVYPGWSNWTTSGSPTGVWEVWRDRRGDVARALFYMDVRYEGGVHSITGAAEPDLRLTSEISLIVSSNTGSNTSAGYMGLLTVLLEWHIQDPVDPREIRRNDIVYSFQGNRNPFIDHPDWVADLYLSRSSVGVPWSRYR